MSDFRARSDEQRERVAAISAAARIAELEAEVARISGRPDLTPEQCAAILPSAEHLAGIVGTFRSDVQSRYPDFESIAAALRAAADREQER